MKSVLAPLPYGGSLTLWAYMVQATHVVLEQHDHYQKQTQRNRLYIHGANGKLMLSIPIKHLGQKGHQPYREVCIDNSFNWQGQHWKSLQAAYRSSPYFEFYEDDLTFLYKEKFETLYKYNDAYFNVLRNLIGISARISYSENYTKTTSDIDIRVLQEIKKNTYTLGLRYNQVFQDKNGFIPELSVLDILFNTGPQAFGLLKKCKLPKML